MRMVEIKASVGLVSASSLLSLGVEMEGEGVADITLLSDELRRERQRNADLMERISILEDQIRESNRDLNCSCRHNKTERCCKKLKRKKMDPAIACQRIENGINCMDICPKVVPEKIYTSETFTALCMGDDEAGDHNDKENMIPRDYGYVQQASDEAVQNKSSSVCGGLCDQVANDVPKIANINQSYLNGADIVEGRDRQNIFTGHVREQVETVCSQNTCRSFAMSKKPLKVAFSPKEVKRITESETLSRKNAQSHTIRKIIVFASLGTRNGCDDMYELDFNHFHILKGQQISRTDIGEHVLYENPGVRRKIFFSNKENPTLCPVQILEEEKLMRPPEESCPSWLFLCIKYGGTTRNLPQNEYVRQRMGRNKLKSFGPTMCEMAMLVHIRSGSFFFKSLGITLIFMSGISDEETDYRSLDLLQKYYRPDADTEGEELFLKHPSCEAASPSFQHPTGKKSLAKNKGKRQLKSDKSQRSARLHAAHPDTHSPSSQFALMGYTSNATTSAHQPTSLNQKPAANLQVITSNANAAPLRNHASYPIFPPKPPNSFMPVIYWPSPITYPHFPYPPCAYPPYSFPTATENYCVPPHWHPVARQPVEGVGQNHLPPEVPGSDSMSKTSNSQLKKEQP